MTVREADVSGLPPEDASRQVAAFLQGAVDNADVFVAVVRLPAAPARRIAGVAERVRMLKRLRPGLATWCRGLAFVMPADAQQQNARAIRAADRVWGCPTLTVADAEQARAWALARLSGSRA